MAFIIYTLNTVIISHFSKNYKLFLLFHFASEYGIIYIIKKGGFENGYERKQTAIY